MRSDAAFLSEHSQCVKDRSAGEKRDVEQEERIGCGLKCEAAGRLMIFDKTRDGQSRGGDRGWCHARDERPASAAVCLATLSQKQGYPENRKACDAGGNVNPAQQLDDRFEHVGA